MYKKLEAGPNYVRCRPLPPPSRPSRNGQHDPILADVLVEQALHELLLRRAAALRDANTELTRLIGKLPTTLPPSASTLTRQRVDFELDRAVRERRFGELLDPFGRDFADILHRSASTFTLAQVESVTARGAPKLSYRVDSLDTEPAVIHFFVGFLCCYLQGFSPCLLG